MVSPGDDMTIAMGGPRPLQLGSIFAGRYRVQRVIGTGGMGSVYEAIDGELDERVALKVLLISPHAGTGALERFRREVRMARRVTHRNAVRTFDIGESEGLHFLTMELVEGESLADLLLREGPLPPARVASIGRQISEGLAAVHEADIIHRDLKPANVLIASSGRVVLTDFGIARPMNGDDGITMDGAGLVGTPHYMSPEQISGDSLTARADLYSLGLVLYEMATGRRPFDRPTAMATAIARLHEEPEHLDRHVALPPGLGTVIMACIERDPERRPLHAAEVSARLADPALMETTESEDPANTQQALAVSPATHSAPSNPSFASCELGLRSLAVLPLRYRGPKDDAYLAEALTEQLIDLLSMTRGLKVPAAGAVERFVDERDPRVVREALGVDTVVDGTMQRVGSQLRVTVRLLDAETGYQTWSERFDGELEDVFELQDHIANRVAETLRLHLESGNYAYEASANAISLYMRARVQMRTFDQGGRGPDGAATLLERCLELAPEFPPALAAYAGVCGRLWFFYGGHDEERDWQVLCEAAVATAMEHAPSLPDTHLAAARMHTQHGCYADAARALAQALDLAPTHAAAHAYLGILQCEAGRAKEGLRHIDVAVDLEPTVLAPLLTAARHHLLAGDEARFLELLRRLWDEDQETRYTVYIIRMRAALWRRDLAEIRRGIDTFIAEDRPGASFPVALGTYALGEADETTLLEALEDNAPPGASPRYRSMLEQLTVEAMLARGEEAKALRLLQSLADDILVDVEWIEHCPLLEPLRDRSEFASIHAKVRRRAQAIWVVH